MAQQQSTLVESLLDVERARALGEQLLAWAQDTVLTVDIGLQAGLLFAALLPAAIFGPGLKRLIVGAVEKRSGIELLRRLAAAAATLATPIALFFVWTAFRIGLGAVGRPSDVVQAAISLLSAWIVIRLVTLLIRSPFWSRVAFVVILPIAALDALGYLDDFVAQLQGLSVPVGQSEDGEPITVSLFDVLRTAVYFALLFWGASTLARFLENRIETVEELTPALRTIITKVMNIIVPTAAFIIALQIVGFDLGVLTVFGGALGLGIGLGLQGVVSNFIAGFTLVADKSIKPGDVIEIEGTFGWVTAMHSRYVAIRTRDGVEHLIPNEQFMTEGVINWSRSDKVVRIHAPFGVSYNTEDLRAVQAMAVEAAVSIERVVSDPKPVCNLSGFGDSAVTFDLRFWITDPRNGVVNVRSAVYLELWDRLRAAGVEIPFAQRELHIKSWPGRPSFDDPEPAA